MSRRRFAARRHHVVSGSQAIERHRRNLENLRGGRKPESEQKVAKVPKEILDALDSRTQPELFS